MSLQNQIKQYFGPETMPFGALSKQPQMLSKKYMEWIRTQPCIVTGQLGVDCHHVIFKSQAKNDLSCVPLSHEKHMELHNHPKGIEQWEIDNGVCLKDAMLAKLMEYIFLNNL